MLRYAITDRGQIGGTGDVAHRLALQAAKWAAAGVDWIQLREKDLGAGEQERITRAMIAAVRKAGSKTRLLVNGRLDVAIAAGADGVHLTSQPNELTVAQVRKLWPHAVVSVACHVVEEVAEAKDAGADMVLYAPVFGKTLFGKSLGGWNIMPGVGPILPGGGEPGGSEFVLPGVGLESLAEACRVAGKMPVYALGGVTWANAEECIAMGAAGVAGIRLFLRQ